MDLKDLAPWIAIAITLALSILVPLFTQIANNKHQEKLQKEQFWQEETKKKCQAYEDLLQKVGAAITYVKTDNLDIAGAAIYKVYLYAPTTWYDDLDKLAIKLGESEWLEATHILQKLSRLMSEELKKK